MFGWQWKTSIWYIYIYTTHLKQHITMGRIYIHQPWCNHLSQAFPNHRCPAKVSHHQLRMFCHSIQKQLLDDTIYIFCVYLCMHNLHTLIHSHVSLTIMTKLSLRFIHKILNTLMLIAIHSSFVAGISLRYVGTYTNPKWKQNAFLYTHLYRPHRHDIGFPQYHASAKVIKVLKLKQSSCSSTHLLQKNWNSICSYKSSLCPQRICKKNRLWLIYKS